MTTRLSPADAAFLSVEDPRTPMHVGAIMIFQKPHTGIDYDHIVRLIEQRVSLVPRYRQRIVNVPFGMSTPRWADDDTFDVSFHVRRSALPSGGERQALLDLAGRVMSRRLDRDRPLWEIYLVEGLAHDQFALITKSHSAMIDSNVGMEIGEVLLDRSSTPRASVPSDWVPQRRPSRSALLMEVTREAVTSPLTVIDNARTTFGNVRQLGSRVRSLAHGIGGAANWAFNSAGASPLNVPLRGQRRIALRAHALDDLRRIKSASECSVNDVLLAVIAGALRNWIASRGEVVARDRVLRALVPVSVRSLEDDADFGSADRITSIMVDLPIGEETAIVRLERIAHATRAHAQSRRAVPAESLASLGWFAPSTMHSLGARVTRDITDRGANLSITNAPGPQEPVYASGARLIEVYPVQPLAQRQALAVGVTSYDGEVYFGLNGDRDGMADLDVLASMIDDSVAELLAAAEKGK
ncbi:WS/DGAT/MGAT family O-acyltransferase [Cumulibacter soli]|uniref:WS/DGAT/MGAT family O-acyltransferase n=1 Tax=Cumulibacter soli TaxID=2546344 RepID=UPI001067E023|nr:wax ester/triacylglycerol synthase family O-acyltransferase [Cumulibacter soli]